MPPRFLAPSMTSCSCSRTRGWPMNSSSDRGRRLPSTSPSPEFSEPGETSRFVAIEVRRLLDASRSSALPSIRQRRDRSALDVVASRSPASTLSVASSACLAAKPRPTSASTTGPRTAWPFTAGAGRGPELHRRPTLSRSSTTMRSAPRLPMPGTRVSAATSLVGQRLAQRLGRRAPPASPSPAVARRRTPTATAEQLAGLGVGEPVQRHANPRARSSR